MFSIVRSIHVVLCTILGLVNADSSDSACLLGVKKRETVFTPITALADSVDFEYVLKLSPLLSLSELY